MKKALTAVFALSLAIGGVSLMGCHASASVEPTSSADTSGYNKKTTTVNHDTGEVTTKTESVTHSNP